MRREYGRYVVGWVPPFGSQLAEQGADWMGWCPDTGQGAGARGPAAARGLHAPLVAPFRLPKGVNRWMLDEVLADLAFVLPPLRDVRFAVAQRPDGPMLKVRSGGSGWGATAVQVAALIRELCGGPMSLPSMTMQLDLARWGDVDGSPAAAKAHFAGALALDWTVGDLAVLGDPGNGRSWQLLERHALSGDLQETGRNPALDCTGPSLMAPFAG